MALLEVKDLTVTFGGTPVLDAVSFAIGKGQRLGLIGQDGAGKSVAALALLGLLPDDAEQTGSLAFDDAPMPASERARAKLRGKRIGAIVQSAHQGLDPLRSVGDHVAEALRLAGQTGEFGPQVDAALKDAGLDGRGAQYPRELSAAERQLAMVAIALCGKPDLLIADEPAAGLDLVAQRQVLDLIARNCSERGMALLLISRDLRAVAMLCTRVAVLDRGRLVELGDKADVFGHPRHDHTRALMAAGRFRARTLMRTPIGGALLEVRNLVRSFRQADRSLFEPRPPLVALDGVSLSIRSGESIALTGPAGAGKSTLGRIIAGLDRASSGELEFDHDVYHGADLPRSHRHEISFVFDDPARSFNPALTIGESIAEPLRLQPQRPMEELSARIVEIVTAVGLAPEMLGRYPHEFAAGDRQRFAIARALITRPRLVIFDEPVAALDIFSRGELPVLLNRLRADFGLTYLVIAHDLDMIRVVADRVIVMDKGKIVATGTPAQLLDDPQEPVTRALAAAALPEVGIVPVF
ncbi:MAG: ABC transporter ATP-binding protein [Devosia nanyangense]|uniref:ABC transporter ATP-binding protein n=1 Tax=Devosia nanyangense TaxID=1228055 RepID=A0A933L154_9HYPH|nr:ABC transporter ATP-binding protein [Devosia nanyangense]